MTKNNNNDNSDDRRRLIIGGANVPKLRYPYYVSINKNNGVIVSGALIAPDIVLTAGHVILDNMNNLTIKIGPWAPTQNESTAETIAVQQYMLHPDWNSTTAGLFQNDFMVMKLEQSAVKHAPILLNRNTDIPTDDATVHMIGVGWTQPLTLSPSMIVQEASLVCISNELCDSAQDPLRYLTYAGEIDGSILCTVSPPNTTRDGCAWDSGDPVIIKGDTVEQDLLVALGSSGVTCADVVFPSTQARVSSGIPWITKMVCELSADPPTDFHCNTTAAIDEQEAPSILTMSSADVVGSLRLAPLSTNSTQQEYSLFAGALFVMAIVAGVVLGNRRARNANRRSILTVDATGDSEQHDTVLHPTTYNSI